ncbi:MULTISPECIES: tRNA (adenosine(37)-N6)-threonylcarbamoyltransferase complex dimerization subunit type 1 TsaB [Methylobacterium]|uniref:Peptidase M22 n=3 Tax=Methylobacterium TaxID=407 RepID=A0A0C6FNN6_9HYPH|nr:MULTISPECIES: tRNA (adenosine(37)-N6)-threonylcarbamoyltransferase complex dimerization subunit type 1 TsaB [Methylobacterium]MBK3395918.1 tRNA (adenosine(37)-N6)-threonylcarbamoyltransferase complex dimerization subunit type 1 TsaB [Methylobacterium ajmalii]MBZ6413770.1 tRNA (adenosine(37)-N6)-threonylcarbamoyltransferase complex dimerization subunit type 1 TsaB [Methylobacterium sp.]MBK3412097.1 tRNA (adenosine(37)-N6)-threonylcarbamoyltransferase complex dimerization subunit type 1 TsaB [M
MRILAIDTALERCAACIMADDAPEPLAQESMDLARGHAEALLPLVERVTARVEGGFESLDRVAVTVGPGSYTGLRVGLSAARAVGLACGIPVVGVTTLSALLAPLLAADEDYLGRGYLLAAAIDARHGHVYFQALSQDGGIAVPPSLLPLSEALRLLGSGPAALAGSAGPALAAAAAAQGQRAVVPEGHTAPQIAWVASLGLVADPAHALARPLYLRGPDAQPQDHMRLPRR